MAYQRGDEGPAAVFYKAYARYYDEAPGVVRRLVATIETATGIPRRGISTWPIDERAVKETAAAFATAVQNIFFAELDLDNDDPGLIDAFVREHLIDPALRRTLDDDAAYSEIVGKEMQCVPDEPLLYYAMGCFMGEWLVRHANAQWFLHAPLDPIQSFPDLLRTVTLTTLAPFSLATKLLVDPVGASFEAVAQVVPSATLFGPVALCASISDSEEILSTLLGPKFEKATQVLKSGKKKRAFDILEAEIEKQPTNGHLLHQAAALGWDYQEYGIVHRANELQLELAPDSSETRHNFAAIESMREGGLESAIELLEDLLVRDPNYTRTRLTLASCYQEAGQPLKAMAQAKWLVDNDPEHAEPAAEMLKELSSP